MECDCKNAKEGYAVYDGTWILFWTISRTKEGAVSLYEKAAKGPQTLDDMIKGAGYSIVKLKIIKEQIPQEEPKVYLHISNRGIKKDKKTTVNSSHFLKLQKLQESFADGTNKPLQTTKQTLIYNSEK